MNALAATFSTAVFRALSEAELSVHLRRRLRPLCDVGGQSGLTLAAGFDNAYWLLMRTYRSEYTFKNELVSKVVFGRHSPATATALLEQPVGSSEADLLVLNGTSTIYEIKTDYDGYSRLSRQIEDYRHYAEFVNVVASERRATSLEVMLPSHVGIIGWRRSGRLWTIRRPESTLDRLQSARLFDLLRTSEALSAASLHLGYAVDVPRGHLRHRLRGLFGELEIGMAHKITVDQLRLRGSSARALSKTPGFPVSLRAAAYGVPLSAPAIRRLLDRLSAPLAIMVD